MSTRRDIIAAVRTEFGRHKFDTFATDPPSIAQGGRGIVVPSDSCDVSPWWILLPLLDALDACTEF